MAFANMETQLPEDFQGGEGKEGKANEETTLKLILRGETFSPEVSTNQKNRNTYPPQKSW